MFSDMQCQFHKIQKFNFNEFIFVKLTRLALERLAAVYSLSCDSHVMVWLLNQDQLFNCNLGTDRYSRLLDPSGTRHLGDLHEAQSSSTESHPVTTVNTYMCTLL